MRAATVRLIQQELKNAGFKPGKVDGKLGDKTYDAVAKALKKRNQDLPEDWSDWSNQRKAVAYLQLMCKERGIEVGKIDGYWGPQTEYACDTLHHFEEHGEMPQPWRDVEPLDANPNGWPRQIESELTRFYGKAGKNQVNLTLPYPHRLAWNLNQTVNSFSCHEKVHDSLERVLKRVLEHYGPNRIRELRLDRWGGCLNVRKMRGGSLWSMHSWGIAVDYDSERNQFKWGRDRAAFAHPDYDDWWKFWEEEGWVSLGRAKNFDWMHVQAAKI